MDIDTVDSEDYSPEGTERKMRAMTDGLEGFSRDMREEAERVEWLQLAS
jgi:hypothetical protein